VPDKHDLIPEKADRRRADLYAISDDLDLLKSRRARWPIPNGVWRTAIVGMLGGMVAAMTVIVALNQAKAGEHQSRSIAREFQRQNPCPSTGMQSGACPGYRKDHVVPLACGAPDSIANMEWQTIAEAAAKRRWARENCARWRAKVGSLPHLTAP
jgi:hypothetical protein